MPRSDVAERIKELDATIAGWIVPVFRREDPVTGRLLNGLTRDDYDRVRSGYACPECLAMFKTYMVTCPVCSWTRNVQEDIEDSPDYWRQHLEDRETGYAPSIPHSIDNVINEILRDKEVEQIMLSKLRKKRRK